MSHIIKTQKAKIEELRATARYSTNAAEQATEKWEILEFQQVAITTSLEADELEAALETFIAESELNQL